MSWTKVHTLCAVAAAAALVACGSGDEDTGSGPHVDPEDTTPPTLLSMTPEDGATGLDADTVVELRFSEAMDPSTVHGTLMTTDLGEVQLEWNEAGDTLTIVPREPLAYAEGDDPAEVEALSYRVILGSAATDLAGNPLGPGASTRFSTLRRITTKIAWDEAMSGSIHPDGIADFLGDRFMVGDSPDDACVRSVMTFDLAALPDDLVEIEAARLLSEVYTELGLPFDLGGAVLLDHVSYAGIDTEAHINAAFNASQDPHANLGPFANADSDAIVMDVTAAVIDDHAHPEERLGLSQYLFRFDQYTNLDASIDVLVLYDSSTALEVAYVTP